MHVFALKRTKSSAHGWLLEAGAYNHYLLILSYLGREIAQKPTLNEMHIFSCISSS